jgi:hypothetical protein
MQPLYSVGTTATLVSIKYKETASNNLNRYEPQPGARSFRRMFGSNGHSTHSTTITTATSTIASTAATATAASNAATDSDEEHVFGTPSLSSSSSSHKNNISGGTPLSHSIPEEEPISIPNSNTNKSDTFLNASSSTSTLINAANTSTHSVNGTLNNGPLSPSSASPIPTSTLSFLARNHTIGRHPRKPKTSITKTNSSFVHRIITNDQLAKILMARTSEDTNLFYNCGTSFVWMDAAGHPKV